MPYPRANKDNQIPTPCPASHPCRLYIDRCINFLRSPLFEREKEIRRRLFMSSIKLAIRHLHVVVLQGRTVIKEMYKKAWCTCTVVVLPNKPIAFLTSSLPSPSSLLKLLGSLGPSKDCLFFNIWKLSHVQKTSWENWKWFLDFFWPNPLSPNCETPC